MRRIVAGVDGCRGGWIVVALEAGNFSSAATFLSESFAAIQALNFEFLCVDIPIGLAERTTKGGRVCDVDARRVLSGSRKSSVFPVPPRAAFAFPDDYAKAREAAKANSTPPKSFAKQGFGLFPKINEVDTFITPDLQDKVLECHPEVCFWALNNNSSIAASKKTPAGKKVRRALLEAAGFSSVFLGQTKFSDKALGIKAGEDDFLDACACAWTAARRLRGEAIRFPDDPQTDERGLRMEIWA